MKSRHHQKLSRSRIFCVLFACCCLFSCGTNAGSSATQSAAQLIGSWKVDLRPTPESPPYYQELVIKSIQGNSFEGSFYGTEVTQARLNADWGKIRIAFVTTDGSGAYHHSAVLEGDLLEGLSNSTGREFLSYWSAVKQ